MDATTIQRLSEAVATFCWNTDYLTFCSKAGFHDDTYTRFKWRQLQQLNHALAAFDPQTLAKILAPEPTTWTPEEILAREG